MCVPVAEAELHEEVDEEGKLPGDVQEEEVLGEAAEEGKLHWREEGGVHRPHQYELRPQVVPPATPPLPSAPASVPSTTNAGEGNV